MASRFINDHIFAGYENCHYTDNFYYARIDPFVNRNIIQQRGRFRIFNLYCFEKYDLKK